MRRAAAAAGKASLYKQRAAQPGEGKRLLAIEMAAGELFREIGMDAIADAPGTPAPIYETFIAAGCARVICSDAGLPIAFLAWEKRDARSFIYELSVHPNHQGRGIGRQLIDALGPATLSCFTDVPWNRPYYERLGFKVIDPARLGPEHMAIAKEEAKRFQPWPRCVMIRQ